MPVSEKDKRYWEGIAKALNQPPAKITKVAKVKLTSFSNYLQFLDASRSFLLAVKKDLSPNAASGVEICHQRAKELHLIRNAH